jgi:hypothetical protein
MTDAALGFLPALYGENAPGFLPLWTRQDKKTRWFPAQDLAGAVKEAESMARNKDVYFGIGLQQGNLGPNSRGTAASVIALPGFWLDLDVRGTAHKGEDLPPTAEAARALLGEFPLPPTMVVHSGHGLQAWWLFRKLWIFTCEEERRKAQELSRRFQAALQAKARTHGWRIDNTSDLARVLRLPGTFNRKLTPVPVRVIEEHPEYRYNPSDFEPYLLAAPSIGEAPAKEWHGPAGAVAPVLGHCRFIQHCRDNAPTLSEPEWWAMIGNLARLDGGREAVHALSAPYPRYSQEETELKIEHTLSAAGPHTCQYIQQQLGFAGCPPGGCGVKASAALGLSRQDKRTTQALRLRQRAEETARRILAKYRGGGAEA